MSPSDDRRAARQQANHDLLLSLALDEVRRLQDAPTAVVSPDLRSIEVDDALRASIALFEEAATALAKTSGNVARKARVDVHVARLRSLVAS